MKKLIVVAALALTGFASFGQGYFSFSGNPRGVWDDFSVSAPKFGNNVNVGFLWGTGSALITGLAASTATNSTSLPGSVTAAQAWTAITTDPNFKIAVDGNTSSTVVAAGAANGGWSYLSAGSFPVVNSAVSTYSIIVFGWSNAYATPALAAAAGSPIGWSAPFSYTSVNNIGTAALMPASGLLPFGVAGSAAVPEPTTIALAGLGGLALLALRRKK